VKVDKDVPIPDSNAQLKYPWAEMDHGDSFEVECSEEQKNRVRNAVSVAGHRWLSRNRPGWKIMTRQTEKGIRAWLIDPSIGTLGPTKKK
jgi:hypothetical protein